MATWKCLVELRAVEVRYQHPPDGWVPITGCAVALVGPLVAISGISKAMTYSSKKRAYERQRRRLLGKIPPDSRNQVNARAWDVHGLRLRVADV